MDVKEKIKSLLENDINDLGYIIWGIEISGNSSSKLVRLFIDKTNGNIDLFDCEKVSNQAIEILNNSDFIDFKYRLEVSSPGIDRSFFGFEQHKEFIGNLIEVKFKPIKSSVTKTCPSQLTDDPIPIVGIFNLFVISFAKFVSIHSSTIENTPFF